MDRRRRVVWAVAAALALAIGFLVRHLTDPVHRIPGLAGPPPTALAAAPPPTAPAAFASGASSRAAILLTDPEAPWLALAFGLKSIGVPFVVTRDPAEAVRHAFVIAYPTISGKVLDADGLRALRSHVEQGGTLLASEVLGGGMADVFGLKSLEPDRARRSIRWSPAAAARWGFTEPEEAEMPFASEGSPLSTYAVDAPGADVVARFDNGAAAITVKPTGRGHAWLVGFDAGALLGSAQQGRRAVARNYINGYEPTADVLLRWLKALYREAEPAAVTLGTVPQGRPLAVALTHDVDFTHSVRNSLAYARSEAKQGVRATYFVQAKYVRDWNDDSFFDTDGLQRVREVAQLGGELASHSVAHSPVFARVPVGSGTEKYPDYAPYVESKEKSTGVTVLGELRVSRFLLQQADPSAPVDAFRPGHLQYPFALPQALLAAGYRFSSSLAAGEALTHLPYRLSHNREGRAQLPLYEFPITLEDERVRPMDSVLLPRALEVARKLARYGGSCVVLIHPNVLDDKLRFQETFVDRMKQQGAWIGPLGDYARWWAARDGVEVDVERRGTKLAVTLASREAIAGLALQFPAGWRAPASAAVVDLAGGKPVTIELDAQ